MTSSYKVILNVIALWILTCAMAQAQLQVDAVDLLDGLELYQDGNFENAARSWGELAARLNDRFAEDETLVRSGLTSVLAAMAWERAGDSRAYTEWARSIETLLKARSSWNEVRNDLDQLVNRSRGELSAIDSETGVVGANSDLVAIMAVYEGTDFGQYDGPAPGLSANVDKEEDLTISRSYFARPLSLVELDESVDQEKLQRRSGVEDEKPAEDTQQIGRGMNSEVDDERTPDDTTLQTSTADGPGDVELDIGVNTSDTARNVTPDSIVDVEASEEVASPLSVDGDGVIEDAQPENIGESSTATEVTSDSDGIIVSPIDDEIAAGDDLLSDSVPAIVDAAVDEETTVMGVSIRPSGAPVDDGAGEQTSDDVVNTERFPEELPRIESPLSQQVDQAISYGPTHEQMAAKAWQYFQSNYQAATGMINAVQGYPRSTLWDVGSGIAAIISAAELGLIDRVELRERLDLYLRTLKDLPLYNEELPNREYSIDSGRMIGRGNRRDETGTGWSALDIGRTLIWLRIAHNWYPEMRSRIDAVFESWTFDRVVENRQMNGTFLGRRGEKYYQEGRLGYEQYSAAGYTLWGFDMARATNYDLTNYVEIGYDTILYDTRTRPFYTSDPFVLSAMELGGIDDEFKRLTTQFFVLQENRWNNTGEISVVAEDSIDREPWFVYNNLSWFDEPWVCVAFSGDRVDNCPTVSTKNALAWSVIYNTPYSRELAKQLDGLGSDKNGFYAGRYADGTINRSLNINTNAIVLEALLYLKRGRKPFLSLESVQTRTDPALTTDSSSSRDSF